MGRGVVHRLVPQSATGSAARREITAASNSNTDTSRREPKSRHSSSSPICCKLTLNVRVLLTITFPRRRSVVFAPPPRVSCYALCSQQIVREITRPECGAAARRAAGWGSGQAGEWGEWRPLACRCSGARSACSYRWREAAATLRHALGAQR